MKGLQPIFAATVVLFVSLCAGCKPHSTESSGTGRLESGANVLLITMDTTRADRIGCYGYDKAKTPTLDALAARGTLFENAFSQVPLTLPSHCSIMTGRYPREHGIRDNARAALGEDHPTLASLFKDRGYRTGAFVASFVLDSRFGIDRGFDAYNDDMGEAGFTTQQLEWEQPANVITDRAIAWLDADHAKPFFCWVHYYDPHDPYDPPEEFTKAGMGPYNGEIAFVDTQIARLTKWLNDRDLTDNTLIVVVGDHGESLGEHDITGHTNFLYWTHVHVPMLIAHPSAVPARNRVASVVETVDLFPTLVEMFGWSNPPGLLSRSLVPAFVGEELESRPAYSESLYAYNSFGWAEQRSLTTARWTYVSSTKPELFDRKKDPQQLNNVATKEPRVAKNMLEALAERYGQMTQGKARALVVDAQSRQKMESLGYVQGSSGSAGGADELLTPDLPDPKDMRMVLKRFKASRELMDNAEKPEDFELIVPLLQSMVDEAPDAMMFHHLLGHCYLRCGKPDEALVSLNKAKTIDPSFAPVAVAIADAYVLKEQPETAIEHFEAAILLDSSSPQVFGKLAEEFLRVGKKDEAIKRYQIAVELMPTFAAGHARLGGILSELGRPAEVITHYRAALDVHPDDPDMHYNLGVVYTEVNDLPAAEREFREAIRLKADFGNALINLGTALIQQGRADEAVAVLEPALALPGVEAKAHYSTGVAMWRLGRIDQTIRMYERAIEIDPLYIGAITELTAYYLSQRRSVDAVRVLRFSVKGGCTDQRVFNTLAKILSTCADANIRNGPEAVALIRQALNRVDHADPLLIQTLATALAEIGDFENAIQASTRALRLAEQAGMEKLVQLLRQQIVLYEADKPYRSQR